MLPMLASGILFPTYDIAMSSLPLEVLRQLNIAFVVSEIIVIAVAAQRGFLPPTTIGRLDRASRWALGLFAVTFCWGGLLVSEAAPFATLFNLSYVVHLVFAVAVAHLAGAMRPADAAALIRIVTLALIVFAAMIAIRFLNPPPGRPLETITWQFAIPGFISVRLFGAMAAAWAAFALWLSLTSEERGRARLWTLAAVALGCGMVVWSGTRAGVLGVGAAGLIALTAFGLRPRLRQVAETIGAVLVGGVLAWALLPYGDPDFWLFVPEEYTANVDGLASGRLAFWHLTWQAFLEVPLFGAGPGATAWILPNGITTHIQPHNLLLQFLLSWGLIATGAALVLLARAVIAAHRRARRVTAAVPYVLTADCLLAMSLVDGTFHFAQHLMIWMAMMGVTFGISESDKDIAAG